MNYPVYKPYLHGNEDKYVKDCLKSSWISSRGEFMKRFEQAFSEFTEIRYACSVSSGTTAIHTALLAVGIKSGDEVIVQSLTYVASVNPILYCGATPVFVDCLPDSWQVDPKDIERKITPKTRAIIAVHLYGHPCDIVRIHKIAREHGLFLIEDCAEAFGTFIEGTHAGSWGDISCFSFFGNKTITTGEGGMVVTQEGKYYERILKIKNQGVREGYYHDEIGYNYRMTNIQAAIGLAQIEKATEIILRKQQIADWYSQYCVYKILSGAGIYWMVCIAVEGRDKLRSYLETKGIETRPVFYPVHKMPMYSGDSLPVTDRISEIGMNLPSYPDLREKDIKEICRLINEWKQGSTLADRMLWWKTL